MAMRMAALEGAIAAPNSAKKSQIIAASHFWPTIAHSPLGAVELQCPSHEPDSIFCRLLMRRSDSVRRVRPAAAHRSERAVRDVLGPRSFDGRLSSGETERLRCHLYFRQRLARHPGVRCRAAEAGLAGPIVWPQTDCRGIYRVLHLASGWRRGSVIRRRWKMPSALCALCGTTPRGSTCAPTALEQ